tara:strand:+ start:417 stop:803 length:387 start_codon:yes stop_codon:yes gene_type:complete
MLAGREPLDTVSWRSPLLKLSIPFISPTGGAASLGWVLTVMLRLSEHMAIQYAVLLERETDEEKVPVLYPVVEPSIVRSEFVTLLVGVPVVALLSYRHRSRLEPAPDPVMLISSATPVISTGARNGTR